MYNEDDITKNYSNKAIVLIQQVNGLKGPTQNTH